MIIDAPLARKILRGEKTTIRRPVDTFEPRRVVRAGRSQMRTPFAPAVGARYPIKSSRSADALCHIRVTALRKELVTDVTFADARAEGFRTRADFADYWLRRFSTAYPIAQTVACPDCADDSIEPESTCPRCDDTGTVEQEVELDSDAVLDLFRQRFSRRVVWVLDIEVERDTPRLLADRHARAAYVDTPSRALAGEPEAIDADTLERYAQDANEAHRTRKIAEDAANVAAIATLEGRLAHLRTLARERGVDVRSDVRVIERRVREIERKIARQRAA